MKNCECSMYKIEYIFFFKKKVYIEYIEFDRFYENLYLEYIEFEYIF